MTARKRRLIGCVASVALGLGLAAGGSAGSAAVGTAPAGGAGLQVVNGPGNAAVEGKGRACNANTYKPKYLTKNVVASAEVPELGARPVPPGGTSTVSVRVSQRRHVTAGVRIAGGASGHVGNVFIGKAEAKLDLDLAAAGASTRTKAKRITQSITNRTGKNKTYVLFRGTTKVTGKARWSSCNALDGTGAGFVQWRSGRLASFTFVTKGSAMCGAGATGAVTREALRRGCG